MGNNKKDNNKAKENGYTQNGGYRKFYTQAKNVLVEEYNKEHKIAMLGLGFVPKDMGKFLKKHGIKKEEVPNVEPKSK